MTDADKARFDACTKLAEIAAGRLDARRQYEWRFTFAFWVTLVFAIAYIRADRLPVWPGVLCMAVYGFWLRGVFVRTASDAELLWHFYNNAQKILEQSGIPAVTTGERLRIGIVRERPSRLERLREWLPFLFQWAMFTQFALTALLLLVFYTVAAEDVTLREFGTLTVSR